MPCPFCNQTQFHKMIIAIDGHSSCGKSSFAKNIAKELNILYIDSGAMYRAATLFSIEKDFIQSGKLNSEKLINSLDNLQIEFRKVEGSKEQEVFLNGRSVENKIRSLKVSSSVSEVSTIPELRAKMVEIQRSYGENIDIVMEGRDIGSVVFPNAEIKIFLTASPEVRARRRHDELIHKGELVDYNAVMNNLMHRDKIDQGRITSPLKQAKDSLLLDNSNMTPEDQMIWFRNKLNESQT